MRYKSIREREENAIYLLLFPTYQTFVILQQYITEITSFSKTQSVTKYYPAPSIQSNDRQR